MTWLPTPGFDQGAETPQPTAQGDMWGTLKQIMGQVPTNVMDPMPLAYVPSAPSFISKLAQGFKEGKMLLPEELGSSRDIMAAGLHPLQNRKNQAFIDQWGNSWGTGSKTHSQTLLELINAKNKPHQVIPLHEYLFNREYDAIPKGLGDYRMIRSAGEWAPGHAGFEVPLNATEDSLKGASELVRKGDTLLADYKIPIRGTSSTDTGPFKEFLRTQSDLGFQKTFTNYNPKKFMDHTKSLNEKVLELYPEFQKWYAQRQASPGTFELADIIAQMKAGRVPR